MTLKFNQVLEVVEVHVRAKFHRAKISSCKISSSAVVHELWRPQTFPPYLAMAKNQKILDL